MLRNVRTMYIFNIRCDEKNYFLTALRQHITEIGASVQDYFTQCFDHVQTVITWLSLDNLTNCKYQHNPLPFPKTLLSLLIHFMSHDLIIYNSMLYRDMQ